MSRIEHPWQKNDSLTALTSAMAQGMHAKTFLRIQDLPPILQVPKYSPDDSEVTCLFEKHHAFFIEVLRLKLTAFELLAVREALHLLRGEYLRCAQIAINAQELEVAAEYQRYAQQFFLLYRIFAKRQLDSEMTSNCRGMDRIRRSAVRLMIAYTQHPPTDTQSVYIESLAADRQGFQNSLSDGTILKRAETNSAAEYQSWISAAAALFLTKLPNGEEYFSTDSYNPLTKLLHLVRMGISFADKDIILAVDKRGSGKYSVVPQLTDPLERIGISINDSNDRNSLQVTDIFAFYNAVHFLYKVRFQEFSTNLAKRSLSREEIPNTANFLGRLLEAELFCIYGQLQREFSFENCFHLVTILERALRLEILSAIPMTSILKFKNVLIQIERLIERTPNFITTRCKDPRIVEQETEYFSQVRMRLSALIAEKSKE